LNKEILKGSDILNILPKPPSISKPSEETWEEYIQKMYDVISDIADLAGDGRTTETVKGNADAIADLAGDGRTVETVKGNADSITTHAGLSTTAHGGIVASSEVDALSTPGKIVRRTSLGAIVSRQFVYDLSSYLVIETMHPYEINWQMNGIISILITQDVNLTFKEPNGNSFLCLIVKQDGVGSREITWPGNVLWAGGTPPVLSTAAGAIDVFLFIKTYDGYFGSMIIKGAA
jgi:hypothetical protein